MSEFPEPTPVPQDLVDAAEPYTENPPVIMITGPTTEPIDVVGLGTIPPGAWLSWDSRVEPVLNGPVMIYQTDPRSGFSPATLPPPSAAAEPDAAPADETAT